MIRLRDLHTLPNPPDDAVVCVVSVNLGFFDNSGDAEDPQHKVLTVGGFFANESQWAKFEDSWKTNLSAYQVPYLHMKEFAHFLGPFAIFKDHDEERRNFLRGCISAISGAGITQSVCHGIRLKDVGTFNKEYNKSVDPFSFCLYIAFIDIQARFGRDTHIELIIDRFSKVTKKIYLAEEYSRTDVFFHHPAFNIAARSLSEDLSFKDVMPLQAADFLVWELRKSQAKYDEWFEIRKPGSQKGQWFPELLEWSIEKWVTVPNERRSLLALHAACGNDEGIFVTYKTLLKAEEFHPNGWGDV